MGHFTWLLLSHLPNIRRHHCYLPNYYTHIHNTRYDLADRCSDLGFRTIPRGTSASLHLLANTLSLLPGHQSSPANVCPQHGNEAKTTRRVQRGINTKKTRSLVRWKRIHCATNHPEKGEHSISSHLEMSNSHSGYAEHRWCSSKEHQNYCWPHENKKILIAIHLYCPEKFCVSKTSPLGHFSSSCRWWVHKDPCSSVVLSGVMDQAAKESQAQVKVQKKKCFFV